MKHIQTSEFGYYLLSELITMPDRQLAAKIELAIWATSPEPDEQILNTFIEALKESECGPDFVERARIILSNLVLDTVDDVFDEVK